MCELICVRSSTANSFIALLLGRSSVLVATLCCLQAHTINNRWAPVDLFTKGVMSNFWSLSDLKKSVWAGTYLATFVLKEISQSRYCLLIVRVYIDPSMVLLNFLSQPKQEKACCWQRQRQTGFIVIWRLELIVHSPSHVVSWEEGENWRWLVSDPQFWSCQSQFWPSQSQFLSSHMRHWDIFISFHIYKCSSIHFKKEP